MKLRLILALATAICCFGAPAPASAQPGGQIGSYCLRPLGIPDKWIENQTPPWDPTDTFDPSGSNPDFYDPRGWNPAEDHGRSLALTEYLQGAVTGQSMLTVETGHPEGFGAAMDACSYWPHSVGQELTVRPGVMRGPASRSLNYLISQDPAATWDPTADGGRGGVVNSSAAYPQSPRIIALPVFAPDAFNGVEPGSLRTLVKIVGFFVEHERNGVVFGRLIATSRLTVAPVDAGLGESAQLSAEFTGPGSPIFGLTIDFVVGGQVIASAQTDAKGVARSSTTSFTVGDRPVGDYPGEIRARVRDGEGFFIADEAAGDLTVRLRRPFIHWPEPAAITYGTPLGPQQLNAIADVEGEFIYSPGTGAILTPNEYEGTPITVRFIPADSELYEEATATVHVRVGVAPLVVTIANAHKLYLDPMPAFSFTTSGLVNGDTVAVLSGTSTLRAEAIESSPVGDYRIIFDWLAAENYAVTLNLGTLTVIPRPTTTTLSAPVPNPATYGQPVTVSATVASGGISPSGTVTLLDFDRVLSVRPVTNGLATFEVSLDGGSHSLSAVFAEAGGFLGSFSPAVSVTVARVNTATQLTSSVNPARSGQAVTFTATVTPASAGGTLTGIVEFLRGGVVMGRVPVTGGSASFVTSSLAVGKHAIQARFAGSTNHAESSSAVLQQTVKGGK